MTTPPNYVVQLKDLLENLSAERGQVMIHETSKSWIFLAATHVYKLKKHVRDELQDLTSLRARHDNCLTEADLNRRLAPETYLGVIKVTRDDKGQLGLGGAAETIDWMVKMQRLPADQMLDAAITERATDAPDIRLSVERLAEKLVTFYSGCPTSNLKAAELITILEDQQKLNVACLRHPTFAQHHERFERVFDALAIAFPTHLKLFEARVEKGWIRECHGDLRPEHICLTDPPIVFDCLEFNRNLRLVDPFSEVMFLGMEADILGANWIKPMLLEHLVFGLLTCPDPRLLNFYEVLHALLRTRLCLAHLLVSNPRTPEKWMPLGLRYFEVAERLLCGADGLAR